MASSRDHKDFYTACMLDLHKLFFTGAAASRPLQQGARRSTTSCGPRRIRKTALAFASEKGDKALGLARQLYSGWSIGAG